MSERSYELGDTVQKDDTQLSFKSRTDSTTTLAMSKADQDALVALGKRPMLKRNFGFMSILGFSCTILISWEGLLIVSASPLNNGGPAGLIFGFLFVWIGTFSIYSTLMEITSMAPTAGGQYHWVSMLAPKSTSRFLSYITGWMTVTGWQASLASAIYVAATLIQGAAVLNNPNYDAKTWQAVLTYFAITIFIVFINAVISFALPAFEAMILVLHVFGFIGILIPLALLGSHADASVVFNTWSNGGNFPTQGLSFMVGLVANAWCFVGADGAVHMSEEIKNASVVVPRSVLLSVFINGSLGLCMMVTVLLCGGDISAAQENFESYPFIGMFTQAVGSTSGALAMISIIIIMQICANVGLLAAASRMTWSFARDRGLPGWQMISKVDNRTSVPLNAITLTCTISCLLALIILGSTTAFNNLVSIGVIALYMSYFIAAALLLWQRLTGGIRDSADSESGVVNTIGAQLVWGPWRMPRPLGTFVNAYACVYMVIMMFFSLWPTELPVTPQNMQYSSLMIGAVVIFSAIWHLVYAKKVYRGPIIETGPLARPPMKVGWVPQSLARQGSQD